MRPLEIVLKNAGANPAAGVQSDQFNNLRQNQHISPPREPEHLHPAYMKIGPQLN